MGRRMSPSESHLPARTGCGGAPVSARAAAFSLVFCFAAFWAPHSASAQTSYPPAETPPQSDTAKTTDKNAKLTGEKPKKMFVEASELVYNKDKNTVSAEGNARVYYKGSVLQADRVVYDRNTGRVYAEGKAQLRQPDGTLLHADRFDLTEDFRDGFIQSLRTETTDKTFLSAPQAERTEGNVTVYDKGTYTACNSCQEDPDRPPLWRVRAKKIIHNSDEQMLYYRDATLEFAGVPIAYVPFFSAPDPTVVHKSGVLSPILLYNPQLGFGTGIPIYWALSPSYDLTLTPTYYSDQGFFGSAQWRQKFDNGSYYVQANGIFQQDPSKFVPGPYGAGDRTFRGSIESRGAFDLTKQWKIGWDATYLSDRFFLNDYNIPSQTRTSNYFTETISDAYLTGQSPRAYFDLRGYYFQGLAAQDFQPQQPIAHPVWDYNRSFDVDPAKSNGLGGQVTFDYNLTSLSEQAATFQQVGTQQLDNAFNLHQVCTNYVPGTTTGSCLLRGIGGDYTRLTADLSWKRKLIDPLGGVWTPFAFARVNGEWLDLNTSQSFNFSSPSGTSTISNASQTNFVGATDAFYGTAMPGAGLEYRYPLITKTPYGTLTLEPIGQIIARPNEGLGAQSPVNMDAQSLVFDDTTLFAWDKYSGYDRFESGVRANYGGQATLTFRNGGYLNFVGGQSYQVAGVNNYATPDAANVGLSSGLDTRASDYVGALTFAPSSAYSFIAKGRFDETTWEPRRIDLISQYNLGAWTGSVQYANYDAQPLIGYYVRREGLTFDSKYRLTDHYFVNGNVTFDMSRQFYPTSVTGYDPGPFAVAAMGLGAGYEDECTTFTVRYNTYYSVAGPTSLQQTQVVFVELKLRTLGDTKFGQSTTTYLAPDSIR